MAHNLCDLPEELLVKVCRDTGAKESHDLLVQCAALHKAWQKAVEKLTIDNTRIEDKDLTTISKCANLVHLCLARLPEDGVPAWYVVATLASQLKRLISLDISGCPNAMGIMQVISTSNLAARLKELTLGDEDGNFDSSHAYALKDMVNLEAFTLRCSKLVPAVCHSLRDVCSKITKLRRLDIETQGYELLEDVAEIFPGSLLQLTSLRLVSYSTEDYDQAQRSLVAAVSALTDLRELSTNHDLDDQALQQLALSALTKLTALTLEGGGTDEEAVPLIPLPKHSELQSIKARRHVVHDPHLLPALTELEASGMRTSQQWKNTVAEASPLQSVYLSHYGGNVAIMDRDLAGSPTLPRLEAFRVDNIWPRANGRYIHLADFLRRHAASLEFIELEMQGPLQEAWPAEMPWCDRIELRGAAVSSCTLQLMSRCSFPQLRHLELQCTLSSEALLGTLEADLGWLRDLPQLEAVILDMDDLGTVQPLKAAVAALLPGKAVVVQ